MIALDTNMLVRAVVADDPAQVEIVRRLMAKNTGNWGQIPINELQPLVPA